MAAYAVLFPVRPRVRERYSREQIELAARVAFWQHPPDDCTVPEQQLALEWTEDLTGPETMMIRVSGDVTPPASTWDAPLPDEAVPIRVTKIDRGGPVHRRRR